MRCYQTALSNFCNIVDSKVQRNHRICNGEHFFKGGPLYLTLGLTIGKGGRNPQSKNHGYANA